MDITHLREDYRQSGLRRQQLNKHPHDQFDLWFKQAQEAELLEPNAMSISTVSSEGHPHSRVVLLKQYDDQGFVFFTNYESQKAQDMQHNPEVALLFSWLPLERQVRVNGRVEKITPEASERYFISRPRGSQIGAWSSPQSQVIRNREVLHQNQKHQEQSFENQEIPVPLHWGGYKVKPHTIEFWQGRSNRLHDRFVYRKQAQDHWDIDRLAP